MGDGSGELGEYGGGNGLRVSFRAKAARPGERVDLPLSAGGKGAAEETGADVVSVYLGGATLSQSGGWTAAQEAAAAGSVPSLYGETYGDVNVTYEEAQGLSVSLRGVRRSAASSCPAGGRKRAGALPSGRAVATGWTRRSSTGCAS